MSTNYRDTLIVPAPDCPVSVGTVPPKPDSVAGLQHAMLAGAPYGLTSDELLFAVHARRQGVSDAALDAERAAFLAVPRACLRASPLVKRYGWGLHHDANGRVALVGPETARFRALADDPAIRTGAGMRTRRG